MSYKENLDKYFDIDKIVVSKNLSEKEAIAELISIALQKREIQIENNKIVETYIVPYENTGVIPDEEAMANLMALKDSLFDPPNLYDRGITRRISRIFLKYYVYLDNWDLAVNELFLLAYYSFIEADHGNSQLKPELIEQSKHIMSMFESLSEKGKENAIIYLMACVYDPSDIAGALDRLRNVKYYIKKFDIPFDDAHPRIMSSYCSALIDTISQVNESWRKGIISLTAEDISFLNEIYEEIAKLRENSDLFTQHVVAELTVLETGLLLGKYTVEDAFKILDNMLYNKDKDNEIDKVACLFLPASYYLDFIWKYSSFHEDKKLAKSEKLLQLTEKRYGRIKKKKDNYYQSNYIANFIMSAAKNLGFERTKDYVFNLTVYADKALYIHTMMVSKIAKVILDQIIKDNPKWLDGVAKMSTKEITDNPARVMKLMDECALFHDIGKHFCIDYVSNSSRNLTDDEFNAIKYHPVNFERFYDDIEDNEKFKCIRDAALLHHLWYNEEGGYPALHHTYNKPFVSIISIADSIDAATDVIGRPYSPGKKLEDLISEFDSFKDTRYSAVVTNVLKIDEVKAEIERLITEERSHLNYQIMTR